MTIKSGNDKEMTASWIRAKAGTIAIVVLLVGVVTAAAVTATPGSRPEVEDNERTEATEQASKPSKADMEAHKERAEHGKGAERDGRPSKADLAERKAAFLEDLTAKVKAGELTRAEAGEMIARLEARIAEHGKQIDRPSKAA